MREVADRKEGVARVVTDTMTTIGTMKDPVAVQEVVIEFVSNNI